MSELSVVKIDYDAMGKFLALLNVPPPDTAIKKRNVAPQGKPEKLLPYLPISYIETKLREIYGVYQVRNFRWTQVANEIIGSVELWVPHPVLGQWICYDGAAAVMICGNKGIEDGKKQANALETRFPKLKTDCVKNAAQGIGKIFGSELRRDDVTEYEDFSDQMSVGDQAKSVFDQCSTLDQLNSAWKEGGRLYSTSTPAKAAFMARKKQLSIGSLNG